MSIATLGLRTQLLESLDWDEDVLTDALSRTYDVLQDLIDDGATPYEAKSRAVKTLSVEYSARTASDLVEYIVLDSIVPPTAEA